MIAKIKAAHLSTQQEGALCQSESSPPAYSSDSPSAPVGYLAATLGITRQGDSLLSGRLVCGKCGARMVVQYHRGRHYRYTCCREATDYGGEICQY